jgi:hypothetical protein
MFFGFGGGGGGITVSAPQSGHFSFPPTSSVRANSRVLQTRQSKPTCSGTAGADSDGLEVGVLAGLDLLLLVGAEIVNAIEQAAQRPRWPIIDLGTDKRDPHPGHVTTVVCDWVEAIES